MRLPACLAHMERNIWGHIICSSIPCTAHPGLVHVSSSSCCLTTSSLLQSCLLSPSSSGQPPFRSCHQLSSSREQSLAPSGSKRTRLSQTTLTPGTRWQSTDQTGQSWEIQRGKQQVEKTWASFGLQWAPDHSGERVAVEDLLLACLHQAGQLPGQRGTCPPKDVWRIQGCQDPSWEEVLFTRALLQDLAKPRTCQINYFKNK